MNCASCRERPEKLLLDPVDDCYRCEGCLQEIAEPTPVPWRLDREPSSFGPSFRNINGSTWYALAQVVVAINRGKMPPEPSVTGWANAKLIIRAVNNHELLLAVCKETIAAITVRNQRGADDVILAMLKTVVANAEKSVD